MMFFESVCDVTAESISRLRAGFEERKNSPKDGERPISKRKALSLAHDALLLAEEALEEAGVMEGEREKIYCLAQAVKGEENRLP